MRSHSSPEQSEQIEPMQLTTNSQENNCDNSNLKSDSNLSLMSRLHNSAYNINQDNNKSNIYHPLFQPGALSINQNIQNNSPQQTNGINHLGNNSLGNNSLGNLLNNSVNNINGFRPIKPSQNSQTAPLITAKSEAPEEDSPLLTESLIQVGTAAYCSCFAFGFCYLNIYRIFVVHIVLGFLLDRRLIELMPKKHFVC